MSLQLIANKISKLSSEELDDLSSILLNEYNVNANLYRFRYGLETNVVTEVTCKLVLRRTGPNKLRLVKEIKEIFDLGLRDAKNLIDNAPCFLKEGISINKAEEIKSQLEYVGATIEIQ